MTARRLSAAALAAALALPASAAEPLIDASTATAPGEARPFAFDLGYHKPATERGRGSVGARGGLAEGKPLETALWGGAGAMAGSVAGPVGIAVGAATGALIGLIVAARAKRRRVDD